MFHRFQYEAEFYPDLGKLPLHVRMKLDLTGRKISLQDWLAFSLEERQALCHLPVENEEEKQTFKAYLDHLCRNNRGFPPEKLPPLSESLWNTSDRVPGPVIERSKTNGHAVTLDEWARWRFHERYALYKTAISKNEPEKFFAVLTELRVRKS